MRLTESTLRRIIMEELAAARKAKRLAEARRRRARRLSESRNSVRLTSKTLNRIIREEYNRVNRNS